jgi:hypothetical protein
MVNDIWGATVVLPELESPPRSVKARGNPRRRERRRGPRLTSRFTAGVLTGCLIAGVVWVADFDRIVARFRSQVTPPPVTAVPGDPNVTPPLGHPLPTETGVPESASASAARESTSTLPESRGVKSPSTMERASATAKPVPAPATVRQLPVATSVIGSSRPAVEPRAPIEPRAPVERRNPVESRAPIELRAPAERRAPVEPRASIESRAPAERRDAAERPAQAERATTDAGDGSAVIDWLLKDRR